jgi:hypothetical protein
MAKTEALSLLDIAPRHEMVEINAEQSLRVRGLSAEDITKLLTRFPALQGLIVGAGVDGQALINLGSEIVGAICAASAGELGNPDAEKMAAALPVETQLDILEAVGRCTFSRGFGPFSKKVAEIARALSEKAGKAPDMSLPKPSNLSEEQPTPTSGS